MSSKTDADILNFIQVLSLAVSEFFEAPIPDFLNIPYPEINTLAEEWSQEPELETSTFSE